MILSYTSGYEVSLDMTPPEAQYGLTYQMIITATLEQTTPLTNSSYIFDLTFIKPVIVAPTISNVDAYCDPNCACTINIG